MPKFRKQENELDGMFDKWMFVLRNLSRLMERPAALQERVFVKLFETAEIAKFTKQQYEEYEDSLKVYRDWKNTLDTAMKKAEKIGMDIGMQKGLAKGLEKGMAEGLEKGRVETAINLKKMGVDDDIISKASGLSIEEIQKLNIR